MPGGPPESNGSRFGETDKRALRKLKVFAIISLVGSIIAVSFFALEYSLFPKLFSISGVSTSVEVQNRITRLYVDTIRTGFVVTNALTVAAIFPLRSALGDLSKDGSPSFRTPRMMMLVMLVCVLVTVVGSLWTPQISSPIPQWLVSAIGLLLNVAVFGILVGLIGGEALGIWRMGSRYIEKSFKAASLLLIVTVAELIYPVLIYLDVPVPIHRLFIPIDIIILFAQTLSPVIILVGLRRLSRKISPADS